MGCAPHLCLKLQRHFCIWLSCFPILLSALIWPIVEFFSFYLKESEGDTQRSSIYWFTPKCLWQPGQGQAEVRNPENAPWVPGAMYSLCLNLSKQWKLRPRWQTRPSKTATGHSYFLKPEWSETWCCQLCPDMERFLRNPVKDRVLWRSKVRLSKEDPESWPS